MPKNSQPSEHSNAESRTQIIWNEIAEEMKERQDPETMVALWIALNRAMLAEQRRPAMARREPKRQDTLPA